MGSMMRLSYATEVPNYTAEELVKLVAFKERHGVVTDCLCTSCRMAFELAYREWVEWREDKNSAKIPDQEIDEICGLPWAVPNAGT